MKNFFRVLNGLMAALFLFAAALQYNDPDSLRWIAIYAAATVPCVLAIFGRARWQLPAVIALASLIWASIYAARGAWSVPFFDMFDEWEMKNRQVLETREMFGLSIIAAWMIVLAIVAKRSATRIR